METVSIVPLEGVVQHGAKITVFGGEVKEIQSRDIDSFYMENEESFTKTGEKALLKALKIPHSFFMKQETPLRKAMIIAQKASFLEKSEEMSLLYRDGKVIYVAPSNGVVEDPATRYPLAGWKFLREDLNNGVQRYTLPLDKNISTYQSSVFMNIPILYDGVFSISMGLYKNECSNSLVDGTSASLKIKPEELSPPMFKALIGGIEEGARSIHTWYIDMIKALKDMSVTHLDAELFYKELMNKESVPKGLLLLCIKHINMLSEGMEVNLLSPKKVESMYDVMDIMTFYAQRLGSVASQSKTEALIYRYLKDRYLEKVGVECQPRLELSNIFEDAVKG